MYEDIEVKGGMWRHSLEDYGVWRHRNHRTVKWDQTEQSQKIDMMLNQNPMSSSEDYESKSCPELDKSALLVAQVKLPCVFEIWPLEHVSVP